MNKILVVTLMLMMIASNCFATLNENIRTSIKNEFTRSSTNRRELLQSEILKNLVTNMKLAKKGSAIEILNNAILSASDGKFKDCDDLIKNFLEDYKKVRKFDDLGNVTQESKDKFLKDYCGIVLYNEDVGAVTGSDIGYSDTPKTSKTIVQENGEYYDLNEYIENKKIFELQDVHYENYPAYPSVMTFKKRNLNVYLFGYEKYSKNEQSIVNAIYSWWLDSALDLIEKSYGLSFNESASVKTIKFNVTPLLNLANIFTKESIILSEDTFASTHKGLWEVAFLPDYFNINKTLSLNIDFNEKSLEILTTPVSISNPGGISSTNYVYWDRIFTHEMVHATMAANINNYWELPSYIKEGLAELVVGGDDTRKSVYYTLLDDINKLTAVYYNNYGDQYSGGCMLLRYFAKQVADSKNIKNNQPMTFSQPEKIGEVILAPMGIFDIRGYTSHQGRLCTIPAYKHLKYYEKGLAKFGNGIDALYFHYDSNQMITTPDSKYPEVFSKFGSNDIKNTIQDVPGIPTIIWLIKTNSEMTFYMIEHGSAAGFGSSSTLIGKNKNGIFIKYFDTYKVKDVYLGENKHRGIGDEWNRFFFQDDTIVIRYGKYERSNVFKAIGEFRFKWDDVAQWFGVEHIIY